MDKDALQAEVTRLFGDGIKGTFLPVHGIYRLSVGTESQRRPGSWQHDWDFAEPRDDLETVSRLYLAPVAARLNGAGP
jgi:hypothetical protein